MTGRGLAKGWPLLFDVLADVESGAWVGAGPIIRTAPLRSVGYLVAY